MLDLMSVYRLLRKDLDRVSECIDIELKTNSKPEAKAVIKYLLQAQGKRIRPVLVFLSVYALDTKISDKQYQDLIYVGAAIELIHMASLIHDDVIDEADIRRNRLSIRSKFGNQVAVTMGVYLYSVSLQLISKIGSIPVLEDLSGTVKQMCEGELLQNHLRVSRNYDQDSYFNIIKFKTAVLFKSACTLGPLIVGAEKDKITSLGQYAYELGYSFQLTDDYLDVFGQKKDLSKTIGQDFFQGVLTLPIIFALELMSDKDKQLFWTYVDNKDIQGLEFIKNKCNEFQIKDQLLNIITARIVNAKKELIMFGDNKFVHSLHFLADYIADRV